MSTSQAVVANGPVPQVLQVVDAEGNVSEYAFTVEDFTPPVPIVYDVTPDEIAGVTVVDVLSAFLSSIHGADRAWYQSLWAADSFAAIPDWHLATFESWRGIFDNREPYLISVVTCDDFTIANYRFVGSGSQDTIDGGSITIRQGGMPAITNEFAEHPVARHWLDTDGVVVLGRIE